jgi:uncharacterized membrane protein YgdD (TMEM256/DUF423 family)
MLIETLFGCALMLVGLLCIIHWLRTEPGNLFLLVGVALFFGALHSCALSACDAISDCVIAREITK